MPTESESRPETGHPTSLRTGCLQKRIPLALPPRLARFGHIDRCIELGEAGRSEFAHLPHDQQNDRRQHPSRSASTWLPSTVRHLERLRSSARVDTLGLRFPVRAEAATIRGFVDLYLLFFCIKQQECVTTALVQLAVRGVPFLLPTPSSELDVDTAHFPPSATATEAIACGSGIGTTGTAASAGEEAASPWSGADRRS